MLQFASESNGFDLSHKDEQRQRQRMRETGREGERERESVLGHCWNWPGAAAKLH